MVLIVLLVKGFQWFSQGVFGGFEWNLIGFLWILKPTGCFLGLITAYYYRPILVGFWDVRRGTVVLTHSQKKALSGKVGGVKSYHKFRPESNHLQHPNLKSLIPLTGLFLLKGSFYLLSPKVQGGEPV